MRGYSTSTDAELMWEGATTTTYQLKSKKTQVSITVDPKGKGSLYFDISAPVYDESAITESEPDKFIITAKKLNSSEDSVTYTELTTLTDDKDTYCLNTVTSQSPEKLTAGTYIFTVQQQTYDAEEEEYVALEGRKQVLIVDIISGVDTVIYGSLDSTGLVKLTYDGSYYVDEDGNKYGLEVNGWKTGEINENLEVYVYNSSTPSEKKYVRQYDTIFVREDDYVLIDFTNASDDYVVYVNGAKVDFEDYGKYDNNLTQDFYAKEESGDEDEIKCSYLFDKDGKTVKAYGKKDTDYLVSIISQTDKSSMTFTIMSRNLQEDISIATGTFTEEELNNSTNITLRHIIRALNPGDIDVEATMLAKDAKTKLVSMLKSAGKYNSSNAANNYITLTLYVQEDEVSETSAKYQIWLEAQVKIKNGDKVTYESDTENIESVNDYVYINMKIQPYLKEMTMSHSGVSMTSVTDINDTSSVAVNTAGYFAYNSEWIDSTITLDRYQTNRDIAKGILDIKTKTFSPFIANYVMKDLLQVNFYDGNTILKTEYIYEYCTLDEYVYKNSENNPAQWRVGSEEGSIFDFDSEITRDTDLYAHFFKPKVSFENITRSPIEVLYGSTISSFETPTASEMGSNAKFLGWYYNDNAYDYSMKITSDITVTAKLGIIGNMYFGHPDYADQENYKYHEYGFVSGSQNQTYDSDTGYISYATDYTGTYSGMTWTLGKGTCGVTNDEKFYIAKDFSSFYAVPPKGTEFKEIRFYTFTKEFYSGTTGIYLTEQEYTDNYLYTLSEVNQTWEQTVPRCMARIMYKCNANFDYMCSDYENLSVEYINTDKISAVEDPTRTGYDFAGWYTTNTNGYSDDTKWDFDNTITDNVNLYAKWVPKTYNITYMDQGGTTFTGTHGTDYPTVHTYGTKTVLVNATKTKEIKFGGWYTDSDCSKANKVTELASDGYTSDITLYAKWDSITGSINGHDYVQLWEGGPKWATMNLGATASNYVNAAGYDYTISDEFIFKNEYSVYAGNFYTWKSNSAYSSTNSQCDTASNVWKGTWRMPTCSEFKALVDNCDWTLMTGYKNDEIDYQYESGCTVEGYKVTGRGDYSDYSIFLPFAGHYVKSTYQEEVQDPNYYGYYWTSETYYDSGSLNPWYFGISSRTDFTNYYDYMGTVASYNKSDFYFSIRPVSD